MTIPDRLDRVVNDLERDQNLSRIRKLLYCTYHGVWEDDLSRLGRVPLRELVQGVWERSPTLDALQFQLNRIVKTLNKPVEYAHVANSILRVMTPLYRDAYDITRPLSRPGKGLETGGHFPALEAEPMTAQLVAPPPAPPPTHATPNATQWLGSEPAAPSPRQLVDTQVAHELSHHVDNIRLKKLLVCVCKNFWENDPARLVALDWGELLRETQQLIPTLENLDYVLQAIVKSLSKPLEYLPIASTLLNLLRPLYEQRPKAADTQFYGLENSPKPTEATQFYGGDGSGNGSEHGRAAPAVTSREPAPAVEPVTAAYWNPAPAPSALEQPTGMLTPEAVDWSDRDRPELANGRPSDEHASLAELPSPDGQDDFSLRLEIMRYANPLMVKIVVFSALHRLFRFSEQDWQDLRQYSLVSLLTGLRQSYPNFIDVETKLCLTAEQIELSENAMKTVAAILKVLKPYYTDSGAGAPVRQFALTQAVASSLEDDLAALAAVLEEDERKHENSCQVFES